MAPDLSQSVPTDLCDGGDALGDFFDPQRAALHREAVAAAAGGASGGWTRDEGRDREDEPGEPQEDHGGFFNGRPSDHPPLPEKKKT